MAPRPPGFLDQLRSPALADLDRRGIACVAGASLTISVLLFALPLYSLQVYDRVFVSRSLDTLLYLSLIVGIALTAAALLEALRGRLLLRIGNAYALALGPRLFDCAIVESVRAAAPGGQALRDLNTIRGFVGGPQGLVVLFDIPLVPLFLGAVYLMHPALGQAMLAGVALLVALALLTEWLTTRPMRAAGAAAIQAQARIDGVLQNADAAEAMGMRPALCAYWQDVQGRALAEASVAADRAVAATALSRWVRYALNLLITATAAWLVVHDAITIGAMVAASILAVRGLAPLDALIGAWRELAQARLAVERINDALDAHHRAEGATRMPQPAGALAVEQLVFLPGGAQVPTLRGVSFAVPAGSWLGLVGPSGAGKTTLARLICGVWQPRSGCVRLDGVDVYQWPREDFGRHCGYLPQDVELFAGTVRDNIARFRPDGDDAQVVAAAREAGAHEMILRLAQGYDTPLGPGGASLSAGQRQRIGLARALFGAPRLVVLDEPNAHLDAEGEAALLQAVNRARAGGATVVMISHRPSLLAGADLLAVLAEGQLRHFGARDEVLRKLQPAFAPRAAEGHARNVA